MYYELTFNGEKEEWYFDAYKKLLNECVSKDKAIDMLCSEVVKDKE
jgi:hypothetical protein